MSLRMVPLTFIKTKVGRVNRGVQKCNARSVHPQQRIVQADQLSILFLQADLRQENP
jgi:hypothetical protein